MKFDKLLSILVESIEPVKKPRHISARRAFANWNIKQGQMLPETKEKYLKAIATSGVTAVAHAIHNVRGRFEQGERAILASSDKNIIRYGKFLLANVFRVPSKTLPGLQHMDDGQLATFFKSLISAGTQEEVEQLIQTARV